MVYNNSNIFVKFFGVAGDPDNNDFLVPWSGDGSVTEVQITLGRVCQLVGLYVHCVTAPGGAFVDTYTVNQTTNPTAAVCTITGAALVATPWTGAIAVAADDTISVAYTVSGGVATRDCFATLVFRNFE